MKKADYQRASTPSRYPWGQLPQALLDFQHAVLVYGNARRNLTFEEMRRDMIQSDLDYWRLFPPREPENPTFLARLARMREQLALVEGNIKGCAATLATATEAVELTRKAWDAFKLASQEVQP